MDFDSLPNDAAPPAMPTPAAAQAPAQPTNFDSLKDDSDQYNTPGQTFQAGVEGAARGVLGPLATAYETKVMGVPSQEILGRQQAHPIVAGVGEAGGLGLGMLTGTGEAAVMSKAGELGMEGLGLAGEATGLGHKIGSAAVQQAIEMGVLTGSDETSKLLLNDPNTSAESALMNTGIGAALGAGFGAVTAGVISPLWKATAGPKVEEFLNAMKNKVNGESMLTLPTGAQNDLETLGIKPSALQTADMSENPTANTFTKNLIRSENKEMLAERQALKQNVAESVVAPLGSNMEDMRVYDNDEAGRTIAKKVTDKIESTFKPLWEEGDKRNAIASEFIPADESKLSFMDRLRERGVSDYTPNSNQAKAFYEASEDQLEFENLAKYDQYDKELRGKMNAAYRSGDSDLGGAYAKIRGMTKDYKNQVISFNAAKAGESGIEGAQQAGEDLIAQRNAWSKQYAQAEAVREQLGDHFNINSDNSRQFMKQLNENMTPEQVLKKFNIKNNSDGAGFLQEHFPEAFDEVVKNERRAILKPAINAAKDDMPIDVNRLNKIIETAKGGKDSYLKTILPQEFLDKAQAGSRVLGQMTNPKDSGTPAGLWGMMRHVGGSAIGAVGYLTGHGIGSSLLLGELATRVGKELPEAVQLSLLRYMGSTEPISAPGFKAMANFMSNTYKGQNIISNAVKNTLKAGAMVVAANNMPSQADRDKLDANVAKVQNNPNQYMQNQNTELGHYMQQHQQAVSQATTRIAQYLQSVKPQDKTMSTLDKKIPPSMAAQARYNRALDIATNPNIVLARIKSGTLQASDITDMNSMYPGLYNQMVQKLTTEIGNMQSKDGHIPYRTRMSLSLFMGQPLDSTMQPMAIMSAQAALQPQQGTQQPQGSTKQKKPNQQAGKGLQKGAAAYKTADQAAEGDRTARD